MEYYSINRFLKEKFGCKVVKLSLDAGFTCPNRDGTLSTKGCIFCSEKGSGDFAGNRTLSISDQIQQQKLLLQKKWKNPQYIAYFQAFTNTYAPIHILRKCYDEALQHKDICGIAIATRPDCLNDDILALLQEFSKKTYLWVELGLQSANENTIRFINRGYDNTVYERAVARLNHLKIDVVTHIILGFPNETTQDMLNTVHYVLSQDIQGIKLQLLHVLRDSPLGRLYEESPFPVLTMEQYSDILCQCLQIIPNTVVIHRLTGDGSGENLIAPKWSMDKKSVLNFLQKKIMEKKV